MLKRTLGDAFIKAFIKEYDTSKSSLSQQNNVDIHTLSNFLIFFPFIFTIFKNPFILF